MHCKRNYRLGAMREDRLSLLHAVEGKDSLSGDQRNDPQLCEVMANDAAFNRASSKSLLKRAA